jgi:high-affinity iron transporter
MRFPFFIMVLLLTVGVLADPATKSATELFTVHCQTCHGPEGRGDGPAGQALEPRPRDLTVRPYKQGCCPKAIVGTLQTGVEGSAMPSFEGVLSEDEMWMLGRYVRSLQGGCCQD